MGQLMKTNMDLKKKRVLRIIQKHEKKGNKSNPQLVNQVQKQGHSQKEKDWM